MLSVFLVGQDYLTSRMFIERGWTIVNNPYEATLIQFTGGEDVDPSLYGEERHATTYSNPTRDAYESHIFRANEGKPMAGICRGGQFLHVMCGGKMWQNVDGHATLRDTHTLYLPFDNKGIQVTSTHHQMMRMDVLSHGLVLGYAKESTYRESATEVDDSEHFKDNEIILHKENVLCFQPHPEYVDDNHECRDLYFDLLTRII